MYGGLSEIGVNNLGNESLRAVAWLCCFQLEELLRIDSLVSLKAEEQDGFLFTIKARTLVLSSEFSLIDLTKSLFIGSLTEPQYIFNWLDLTQLQFRTKFSTAFSFEKTSTTDLITFLHKIFVA